MTNSAMVKQINSYFSILFDKKYDIGRNIFFDSACQMMSINVASS